MLKTQNSEMTNTQRKEKEYGINSFERKLLNSWLTQLKIDNGSLTVEQRKAYIEMPGFQALLKMYRDQKKERAGARFMVSLKRFIAAYFFILVLNVIACVILLHYMGYLDGAWIWISSALGWVAMQMT